jgi:FkbM family methyltransferase
MVRQVLDVGMGNKAKTLAKFNSLMTHSKQLLRKCTYLPQHLTHRRQMVRFYSQLVSRGDLCFDIGANLGNRTDIFLRLGATVVAVEPQSTCMNYLNKKYGKNNRVTLIQKAVGEKEGQGEMFICSVHWASSMSKQWINSVKSSGRLQRYYWNKTESVPMTTLDKLIEEFGKPSFCKIDVEGYEFQVLKGLSQSIKTCSFEFTPEFIDSTIHCISYLSKLGFHKFSYSIGESMQWAIPKWVNNAEICMILTNLPDKTIFGDVYAR